MSLKIIQNNEVTKHWFDKMVKLEHEVWPKGDPSFLPVSYLKSIYQDTDDVCFYAINEETDELAGYFTVVFLSEDNFNDYYRSGDFTVLKNLGMKKGKNIVYLYTANVSKKYQGTDCMKRIGVELVKWLDKKEKEGYLIDKVYAEAVSEDGVRTIVNGFGLLPMNDVDENGLGHYYCADGLKEYRRKMRSVIL